MSDDPALKNALRKAAEADEAIERLKAEKADALRFVELYRRFAGGDTDAEADATASHPAAADKSPLYWTTAQIQEAGRAALTQIGHPVHIREIYNRLLDQNAAIPGKNPMGNLSAKLYAAGDLVFIAGVGWWFKDRRPYTAIVNGIVWAPSAATTPQDEDAPTPKSGGEL